MSRAAITVGDSAVLVLDRADADDLIANLNRAAAVQSLGYECDSPTRVVSSGGAYYADVLQTHRIGSPARISGHSVDSQWAGGAFVPEADVEDFSEYLAALNDFWLGPCRPLAAGGYPLPTAAEVVQVEQAVEENREAWRLVRDDPEIEIVEIEDSGTMTATTTEGQVFSVPSTSGSVMSTGTKVGLAVAVFATVVGGVYLLTRGKRR